MKTDWNHCSLTSDSTSISTDCYKTTTTNAISTSNNDIYDAIYYAAIRSMDMEEKKAKGVGFDALEKTLRKMGIFLTEIHQDSYNDYAEITCRVNPIDWYTSLDGKDAPPVRKKDDRPYPKKVKFSGPATIILWEDGTKTVVKCQEDDVFNEYTGVLTCFAKKMFGNKANFNNIINKTVKMGRHQTTEKAR